MSDSSPRPKLLLLCEHFYPEMVSTGMHMTELALGLTRIGWEIHVVCTRPSETGEDSATPRLPARMEHGGILIHRVFSVGRQRGSIPARLCRAVSYLVSSALWSLWNAGNYDGLLITTNPPFIGLAGKLVQLIRRKPYVMIVYDIYPEIPILLGVLKPNGIIAKGWSMVSKMIFRGAAVNVVIGRDMDKIIRAKLPPGSADRIEFITNWSDAGTVRPSLKSENKFRASHKLEKSFVVQYSGTMGRTHNLEPLIDTAEILRAEGVFFQFIGTGAKKAKLEQMAAERNLTNVQFLPSQPFEILGDVLSSPDIAVVCLSDEFTGYSVPSKTYGIMAAGVPILAFLNPESEIGLTIRENDCGKVLFEPKPEEIARVIRQWKSKPDELKRMGTNGYETFKLRHTLDGRAVEYDKVLKRAFALPPARQPARQAA